MGATFIVGSARCTGPAAANSAFVDQLADVEVTAAIDVLLANVTLLRETASVARRVAASVGAGGLGIAEFTKAFAAGRGRAALTRLQCAGAKATCASDVRRTLIIAFARVVDVGAASSIETDASATIHCPIAALARLLASLAGLGGPKFLRVAVFATAAL
jgi:hypothetical protein